MSICPFVSPAFFSGMGYYFKFYFFFSKCYIFGTFKNWQSLFFPRKFIIPQIWIKKAQNGPKTRLFRILWKLQNIVIGISPPIPRMAKFWFYSYGSKCCWPIKLQDSLKCIIPRKKWTTKFIFDMQMDKLTLHNFGFA